VTRELTLTWYSLLPQTVTSFIEYIPWSTTSSLWTWAEN